MKIDKSDFIKYIKKNFSFYLSSIIKFLYNKNTVYKNINSQQQIKTIVKSEEYYPLLKLLLLKDFAHLFPKLDNILLNTKSDKVFYKYLYKNQKGGSYSMNLFGFKIKKYLINKGYKIRSYLDVGCSNGKKTVKLANYLNIKDYYGTDIDHWYDIGTGRDFLLKDRFKLIKNNKYDFKDNRFDLVSCFMVLHHIPQLEKTLKEITRVLKPGGFLIISEHDAFTDYDKMLIDVEHLIYEMALKDNQNILHNYYGKYYNLYEWHYIMDKFNFKLIQYKHYNVFAGARFNVNATRYFYAIYQKK